MARQTTVRLLALVTIFMETLGCRTAPMTGRRQLLMIPEQQEIALGLSAYQETLAKSQLSTSPESNEVVQRVGSRIAQACNRPDYDWEFRLVASPEMNAFCLPGGKVVVHEGILPVCQNEAGLAVVLSHEIAHALARHGGERMSQGYMVNGVGAMLSYATQNQAADMRQRMMKAYGLASEYGFVLPYSRKHESEADHMGLLLMARAGYDPEEAPRFWSRFGAGQADERQPEFLSTHPANERRAADLTALLPEAKTIYDTAAEKFGSGQLLSTASTASASDVPPPQSLGAAVGG